MLCNILFIVLGINCLHFTKSDEVSEQSVSKFNSLANCIVKISKIDMFYSPTVLLEYNKNIPQAEDDFLTEMVNQLKVNNIPQVIIKDKYEINNLIKINDASWLVLLYFNDCEALFNLKVEMFKDKVKYLIIVNNFVIEVCKEVAVQIGNKIMMYDVTFVVGDSKEYHIVTFIPIKDPVSCKVVVKKATLINHCINGTMKSITSFPDTTPNNYNKCIFKVGMGTLYPLSIINNKDNMKTYDRVTEIRGSDFEIIKIITKQFNTTLEMYYVAKMEESPYVLMDFLPFITNRSLDAIAGGFYRIYGDIVDYSGIYARQAIFWLYTADRDIRSWQNFINKIDGLYIFFIFYVIYTIIWYFVSKFDKQAVSFKSTLLYSWGTLVGTSSLGDPKTFKQKILNLGYLIMCLHLSAYLSIQFYSFLTILGPPKCYTTNDDIMQSGRVPYLKSASKYFVSDEKYVHFANTSEECKDFWDCSKQSLNHKGITLVPQNYFTYFQATTSVGDEATVLRVTENFLTVYYEMLIRKDSSYVRKFQDIIQRLFEAGIPDKLYKESIGLLLINKAEIARKNLLSNSYNCGSGCQISLELIAGAFYLWIIGCGLSLTIFIVEVVSRNGK